MTVFSSSLCFLVLLTFTMSDGRGLNSFNKVHLDLYYESLCPDCSSFIQSQLKPTWERLHRSKIMSISLYPFGNAKEHELANGTFTYTCQHGEEECFGNFVEACILKLKQFDADQYMPMIACIEEGVQTGKSIKNVVQSCLRMHLNEKSQSWVMECATVYYCTNYLEGILFIFERLKKNLSVFPGTRGTKTDAQNGYKN